MTEILTIKKIRNKARAKKLKEHKHKDYIDRTKGECIYRQYEDMLLKAYKRTHLGQGD